jgi:hypothetical protein
MIKLKMGKLLNEMIIEIHPPDENCQDCIESKSTWMVIYKDEWKDQYFQEDEDPVNYFCDRCLINNCEGLHSGGGPTIDVFKMMVRIDG